MPSYPDKRNDDGHWTQSVSGKAATRSIPSRLMRTLLALVLGLSVGQGLQKAILWWQGEHIAFDASQASVVQGPAPLSAQTQSASNQVLQTWLILGTQEHSLDQGQISLPSGTRFQIRVLARQAGVLSVSAVNPAGEISGPPLWSADVTPGASTTTPVLRLEGTKGRETLIVILRAMDSQKTFTRNLHLWHL